MPLAPLQSTTAATVLTTRLGCKCHSKKKYPGRDFAFRRVTFTHEPILMLGNRCRLRAIAQFVTKFTICRIKRERTFERGVQLDRTKFRQRKPASKLCDRRGAALVRPSDRSGETFVATTLFCFVAAAAPRRLPACVLAIPFIADSPATSGNISKRFCR